MAPAAASARSSRPGFRCTECGWTAVKWVGRCGECQAWGSVTQMGPVAARTPAATSLERPAVQIGEVDARQAAAVPTGASEFDRVLGGGLVPGGVVLVAGEPGVGKSTLLLDVAARVARGGAPVLYVSGEESAAQIRLRAERIGAMAPSLFLASETDLANVLAQVEHVGPALLVLDSVQTIASTAVDGSAGNVSQVREVAGCLIQLAKRRDIAVLLVGHVTKDGSIAGPRALEHVVDVVAQFEGDRHGRLRLLRAVKNRFGPTDEVGCFEVSDGGVVGLTDPSGLFLSSRDLQVAGTCVTVTLEGRRPLVTEVQALVTRTQSASPRRTTSGVDSARVAMVLAVLDRRTQLPVGLVDCYVSTVGGVRLAEPAVDLAVALAVAGSAADLRMPSGTVAFGEVGLAGEVRPVTGLPRRLAEAARLGFTRAIVPVGTGSGQTPPPGLKVHAVADVAAALGHLADAVTRPVVVALRSAGRHDG